MVTRDKAWAPGTPCWVDVGVDNISRAGSFYGGLFGWEVELGSPETGGYAMCRKDGRAVAGIGPKQGPPGTPSAWTTYLATGDASRTAARITAAGGQLVVEPMAVMAEGRMALAADPAGAVFGIWQAGAHTGVGLANEPGSLCWNENFSRDFDGNRSFYRAVFGYEYEDLPGDGMRYATIKVDGAVVGGIGEIGPAFPPGMPPCWTVYFATTDTDAAAAAVTAAGGGVDQPPWDTPYGRMAVVHDDQGAVFSLITVPGTAAG